MSRAATWTRAALALAALALAGAACDVTGPGGLDLERMIDQAKAEPYEATPFFPDGRVLRTPPPGTIARGALVGDPAVVEGTAAGAPVGSIPVPVTPALIARGRDRFESFCAACHGLAGDGQSIVAGSMKLRPPPSLHDARRRALAPGRIFQVATKGYGLMPSFEPYLSIHERWAVVAYVRALQLSQGVPLDRLPPALADEARRSLP